MRRFRKQQGFTLAETVVAMALLAIIMMAVLPLVDQIICRFQMARDHYVAATLCQGRIERARSEPYDQLEAWEEVDVLVDAFGNPLRQTDASAARRACGVIFGIRPNPDDGTHRHLQLLAPRLAYRAAPDP